MSVRPRARAAQLNRSALGGSLTPVKATALLSIAAAACTSSGLCGNAEQTRVASPNGAWDAVVFVRDCGATTGFSSQVSLVPNGAKLPNEPGNVFALPLRSNIDLRWTKDTLWVAYPHATPTLQEHKINSIVIVYAALVP